MTIRIMGAFKMHLRQYCGPERTPPGYSCSPQIGSGFMIQDTSQKTVNRALEAISVIMRPNGYPIISFKDLKGSERSTLLSRGEGLPVSLSFLYNFNKRRSEMWRFVHRAGMKRSVRTIREGLPCPRDRTAAD
jgi:hypothetical protein